MNYKFFIINDEQEFKNQYFKKIKEDEHISLWNFNYYLIDENYTIKKYFLFFTLEKNEHKQYNNTLYRISNKFGDYINKEQNITHPQCYLMLIKDNYYLYYHLINDYHSDCVEIVCRIVYLNNNLFSYDNDNLAWDTVTSKKVEGLIPFNAKKEVEYKLPIFVNTINSLNIG